jgi:hypothetical protein
MFGMVSSMAIYKQSCFRFCEGVGVAIIHMRTNLATGQIGKQKHLGILIYFGDMLELRTFCLNRAISKKNIPYMSHFFLQNKLFA